MYWIPNDGYRLAVSSLFSVSSSGFSVCGVLSAVDSRNGDFGILDIIWVLGAGLWALAGVLVLGLVLVIYLYSSILWLMFCHGLSRLLYYRVKCFCFSEY